MRKVRHPRFPQYLIREDGLVERAVDGKKYHKAGDILRGRILASGYRQFTLRDANCARCQVRANRLVCEAFHGLAPLLGHHAAHRNGKRLDDRPANLYWATPAENKSDSVRHGTSVQGMAVVNQHGRAKFTDEDIILIRAAYTGARGDLVRLAREHGVYPTCIQKIVTGQTWRHVSFAALDQMRAEA